MFVNFPDARELAQKIAGMSQLGIELELRRFQSHTIMELANAIDGASLEIERQRAQVFPADLRTTAQRMREWGSKIESGEKP